MYSFIALGHSHIVAFAKAAYEYQASDVSEVRQIDARFVYLYDEAYVPVVGGAPAALNPRLCALLNESTWNFVVLVCGGNEHNVLGIVKNKRPFDFVLSSEPDLPLQPGHELVPEALIREVLKSHMSEPLAVLRAVRTATRLPILELEPPPPLPNHRVLAYPSEFVRARLLRKNIAPELIRYKLWRLESEIYRRLCEDIGIAYLRSPQRMIGENGMLAEEGWGADATHANSRYGREVLDDALDFYQANMEDAQVSS